MLSDPGDASEPYPIADSVMLPSSNFKLSAIPDIKFTRLNHFSTKAYGLHHPCLRLDRNVTVTNSRLGTGLGGFPLSRRYFQPLATKRLVAHKIIFFVILYS
jgi:hypothetical protein